MQRSLPCPIGITVTSRRAVADDIVTRLRIANVDYQRDADLADLLELSVDYIERLHAEINDLRLRIVALSIAKEAHRG